MSGKVVRHTWSRNVAPHVIVRARSRRRRDIRLVVVVRLHRELLPSIGTVHDLKQAYSSGVRSIRIAMPGIEKFMAPRFRGVTILFPQYVLPL